MIYEALLVPNEFSPHARDIKRALLTYDKVVLIDPGDRELIPRSAFMLAMGMPPIKAMLQTTLTIFLRYWKVPVTL